MIGPFTWDDRVAQYRDARGRFVPRSEIRAAIDRALDNAQVRLLRTSERLRAGEITLSQWRTEMMRDLKDLHLYSGAAAKGGWAQMTQADYGRIGRILRDQYRYLNGFVDDIAAGIQAMDGRFLSRVKLYVQSGRVTYHKVDERVQADIGMSEKRNVLHPAEHCGECLEQEKLGWVALDDDRWVDVGERECLSNDRCTVEYR